MSPKRHPKQKSMSSTEHGPTYAQYDSHHSDREAKLILVSSDNVRFRVHAWYLKQKSDFINGLLDVPSNQPLENAPIYLNQKANIIRKLLDLIYSTSVVPMESAAECIALLELCDRLQMPTIEAVIWRTAKARLNDDTAIGLGPWEVFRLGAAHDMPQLCGTALTILAKTHPTDFICHQSAQFHQDIPSRYLSTLLANAYYSQNGCYRQTALVDIAQRFHAMRKEGCH